MAEVVSIIIPAYNAEKYLERCFASIYQSAPDRELFEVVVVNDGSTDNTSACLHQLQEHYLNLKVIDQPNGGVSVARNNGICSANGDYVLFLDADDELVDGALAMVCNYLKDSEPIDMLVTRQIRRTAEREWMPGMSRLEEHRRYSGVEAFQRGYVRVNAGGGICRTTFLREHGLRFPEGVKNAEDTIFFGQLQVYAQSIVYYNLPLYIIHMEEGSASRTIDYTKLGKSHIVTMRAVAEVKQSLMGSKEQLSIFDFVVYQLLSNTIGKFVSSKDLSYILFRKEVDCKNLLPLDTQRMCVFKDKSRLMNFSLPLFYFCSWLKHLFDK